MFHELFTHSDDWDEVQAVTIQAAIQGDVDCRDKLPHVQAGFEEPYRTIATAVSELVKLGTFVDRPLLLNRLHGQRFTRLDQNGREVQLAADEAINLVVTVQPAEGQAAAYLPRLAERLEQKRRERRRQEVRHFADKYAGNPELLMERLQSITQRRSLEKADQSNEAAEFEKDFAKILELQNGQGFRGLDCGFELLHGKLNGLQEGLLVLAAMPSAGKSTLAWQMARQVAEKEKVPVILVTYEQSSREFRIKVLAEYGQIDSRMIVCGGVQSPEDRKKLEDAAERYRQIAPRVTLVEADPRITVGKIRRIALQAMAQQNASRCLVVIDYLQLMPLPKKLLRQANSAKDRLDMIVSALRRLARKLQSPILTISSENRAHYDKKSMAGFKESGGIEYAADVAMILTTKKCDNLVPGMQDFRQVELSIIKNRNGALGNVFFNFYPAHARFVETGCDGDHDSGNVPPDDDLYDDT